MSILVDSYSENNADAGRGLYNSSLYNTVGQSFLGVYCHLSSIKVELYTEGSLTGSAYAKLYSHSGVYGTSSGFGDLLAISDPFDVSVLPTFSNKALFQFDFSGINKYKLRNNTYYCLQIFYDGGDADNRCIVQFDQTSPTHDGNMINNNGSADSTKDLAFYVYGEEIPNLRGGSGVVGGNYSSQTYFSGHPKLGNYITKVVSDTVYIADTFLKTIGKNISSLVNVSDIKSIGMVKTVSDTTIISDVLIKIRKFFKVVSDTVQVTDTFFKKIGKSISSLVSVSDVQERSIIRRFLDSVVVSDSVSKKDSKTITNTVVVSDQVNKSIEKNVTDNVISSDTNIKEIGKNVTDHVTVSENIRKSVTMVVSNVVYVTDSIRRRLNGLLILWEKVKKGISDWTKRTRSIEEFSSVAKSTGEWEKRKKNTEDYSQVSKPSEDWTKLKDEQHNE